jgi:hypothetical protein
LLALAELQFDVLLTLDKSVPFQQGSHPGGLRFSSFAPAAPAKTNFSGTWRLNKAKSNYGPVSAPNRMERRIVHEDPTLKMTIVQANDEGERTLEQVYRTDGSQSINKVGNREVTSTAKWDGQVLVISSERGDFAQSERWTLSGDGQVLTLVNRVKSPKGNFEVTVVMDKE